MTLDPQFPLNVTVLVLPLPLGWQLLANPNGTPVLRAPTLGFNTPTSAMLRQWLQAIHGWATCPCTATLRDTPNPRMLAAQTAIRVLRIALLTTDPRSTS